MRGAQPPPNPGSWAGHTPSHPCTGPGPGIYSAAPLALLLACLQVNSLSSTSVLPWAGAKGVSMARKTPSGPEQVLAVSSLLHPETSAERRGQGASAYCTLPSSLRLHFGFSWASWVHSCPTVPSETLGVLKAPVWTWAPLFYSSWISTPTLTVS